MTSDQTIAIVRPVPDSIGSCELTHMDRAPIDLAMARSQHENYTRALANLGCEVITLPPLHAYPDSVFVEDPAVVLDELAILGRSGAESRRGEVDSVAEALAAFRSCRPIEPPGCIDGGDVLQIGRRIFVGISTRTNETARSQLRAMAEPLGYEVIAVPLVECLHLKTAASAISDETILCNPEWVDPAAFTGTDTIEIDPAEPFSGNVLRVESTLVADSAWTGTNRRLVKSGFDVVEIHLGELSKAEGSVTCSSIVFSRQPLSHHASADPGQGSTGRS
jgi:dimethylargininase